MKSLRLSAAGSESNVAIGVCRLGYSASWTGRVGADELGQMILASLRAEGVDVSRTVIEPSVQTALMFKERRGPNVARVTYYRSGYAGSRLSTEDLDESLISAARVLHVTGITLALSETARAAAYAAVEIARSAAVPVSFDFNYRSALWPPRRLQATSVPWLRGPTSCSQGRRNSPSSPPITSSRVPGVWLRAVSERSS